MADWKQDYLHTAAEQIRWKRARKPLLTELEDHLESERETLIAAGLAPEQAGREALRQMGDPVQIGQALDRVHKPKHQWGLIVLTILIAIAGALVRMLVARGSIVGETERVLFYLALGMAALFGGYFLDYSFLGKHAGICYAAAVAVGILSLVFSPLYAGTSYYTRYFVVMVYPVVYAALVYRLCAKGWLGLFLALGALLPLGMICLAAPSILGLLVLGLTAVILLIWSVWRGWFRIDRRRGILVLTSAFLIGVGILVLYAGDALARRLWLALVPELDPQGQGFLANRIAEALGNAQLLGQRALAPGEMQANVSLLPGWDTDALLTSMICRWGWLPFGLVCAGLLLLLVWILVKILKQRSVLGQLVSVGILLTLALQILCSIAMNLGFVFVSATCPFLMGNLHSVLDMALMGMLLSVFRQERIPVGNVTAALRSPRIFLRSGELVIRYRKPDKN